MVESKVGRSVFLWFLLSSIHRAAGERNLGGAIRQFRRVQSPLPSPQIPGNEQKQKCKYKRIYKRKYKNAITKTQIQCLLFLFSRPKHEWKQSALKHNITEQHSKSTSKLTTKRTRNSNSGVKWCLCVELWMQLEWSYACEYTWIYMAGCMERK